MTDEKVELGRHLFYDERLSGTGAKACATCHLQEHAFAGGVDRNEGATGARMPRHSQPLVGAAYAFPLTWSNLALTDLERQIRVPLFDADPIELGVTGREAEVLARLRDDSRYRELFRAAFPEPSAPDGELVTFPRILRALASFVRAIVPSGQSPFHRYVYGGDPDALSPRAERGLALFDELGCRDCHAGVLLTRATRHRRSEPFFELAYHNTGLYNIGGDGAYPAPNTGLREVTRAPEDMGRFRVPTLRNVAVTGPYMHDGSVDTLEEVIAIYERGGRLIEDGPLAGDGAESPYRSRALRSFELTPDERADLLRFLESLTDEELLRDPRLADPWAE